jgi:hypothetical protein
MREPGASPTHKAQARECHCCEQAGDPTLSGIEKNPLPAGYKEIVVALELKACT